MESETKAVIFAADDGTAINSKKSVALHKILDKTVLEHTVSSIKKAGIHNICVVISGNIREFENIAKNENISIAVQNKCAITMQTFVLLENFLTDCRQVVILESDMPMLSTEILTNIISEHVKCGKPLSCISSAQQPGDFSVEANQITKYEPSLNISQITQPQIYCFTTSKLCDIIKNNADSQNLFYESVEILEKSEYEVSHYTINNTNNFYKIKNRENLIAAIGMLSRQIVDNHINNGVTVIQPESAYIGADVEIGIDSIIYPGASLEGKTKIGENCVIGYNSRIVNSTISNDTEIYYSTILDSSVGSEVHIGPYAFVRPNSKIGNNVKIGDFVEIKNATLGDNTKVSHLTYIGDADVGEGVNFGCGTVIVNYDGDKKHRSTISDRAFIGCSTNLVSPVKIGKNAFTAAGSTITEDVPEDALALARSRQVNKLGWRIKKKLIKKYE